MITQLALFLSCAVFLGLGYLVVALFGPADHEEPEGLPKVMVIEPDHRKW